MLEVCSLDIHNRVDNDDIIKLTARSRQKLILYLPSLNIDKI